MNSNIIPGKIHYHILNHIIDKGYSPEIDILANLLDTTLEETTALLDRLADYHGVVLHPNSVKIWVIHPFSLAPTNFIVSTNNKRWWGNCA